MKFLIALGLILLVGCKPEPEAIQTEHSESDLITSCDYSLVDSNLRNPKTINQMTDLINALPKPLSLPCLVESLERPLKLNITSSRLSAQPAVDASTPRIFIFKDDLVISIVPGGKGADLLELSEMYADSNSLKAELEFPIKEQITYQTGYDRINIGGKSTCAGCHSNERPDNSIAENNAYTSVALKPESNIDLNVF